VEGFPGDMSVSTVNLCSAGPIVQGGFSLDVTDHPRYTEYVNFETPSPSPRGINGLEMTFLRGYVAFVYLIFWVSIRRGHTTITQLG
jgi:hypothetical protein